MYELEADARTGVNLEVDRIHQNSIVINPDKLLVEKNESKFNYSFTDLFLPPLPLWNKGKNSVDSLAIIHLEDEWYVSHKYRKYYIIQSDDYNLRQCKKEQFGDFINVFGKCKRRNDYGFWILDNNVIGWANLPGPLRVFSARKVQFVLPGYYDKVDGVQ